MSKVNELRKIIKDLPQTTLSGALGSNSVIQYSPRTKEYGVFCGRLNPEKSGTFKEVKEWLEEQRDRIIEFG